MFPRERLTRLLGDVVEELERRHAQLGELDQQRQEAVWASLDDQTIRDLHAAPVGLEEDDVVPEIDEREQQLASVRGLLDAPQSKPKRTRAKA